MKSRLVILSGKRTFDLFKELQPDIGTAEEPRAA